MQKTSHTQFEIQNNLRLIRKRKGMTQEQVARQCYIRLATYSSIENGKSEPAGMTMLLIAKALGETVDRLFFIKELKVI